MPLTETVLSGTDGTFYSDDVLFPVVVHGIEFSVVRMPEEEGGPRRSVLRNSVIRGRRIVVHGISDSGFAVNDVTAAFQLSVLHYGVSAVNLHRHPNRFKHDGAYASFKITAHKRAEQIAYKQIDNVTGAYGGYNQQHAGGSGTDEMNKGLIHVYYGQTEQSNSRKNEKSLSQSPSAARVHNRFLKNYSRMSEFLYGFAVIR